MTDACVGWSIAGLDAVVRCRPSPGDEIPAAGFDPDPSVGDNSHHGPAMHPHAGGRTHRDLETWLNTTRDRFDELLRELALIE